MKTLPYIVFCFLVLCALCTGINSYRRTEYKITQDVNRALEQVLAKMPDNVVTTDTIRCYRNCLTIAELRDTAGIAMRTVRKDGRLETTLVAEANCGFATTFVLSDQKASGSLFVVGMLWLLGSLWYAKRKRSELMVVCRMEALCTMTASLRHFLASRYILRRCSILCSKCS